MTFIVAVVSVLILLSCSTTEAKYKDENPELVAAISLNIPEPSGLTFQADENVLWTLSDNTGKIYKLETDGTLLQTFDVGGEDLEGIVFDETDGTLWVVEEGNRKLIHLSPNGDFLEEYQIPLAGPSNNGLEGICFDAAHRIHLLNEKNPGLMIDLDADLNITNQINLNFAADYSGICFDKESGNFWIVSDESRKIFVWNEETESVEKEFELSFPKAEGVAFDEKNNILYLVSDSENKLYVFRLG